MQKEKAKSLHLATAATLGAGAELLPDPLYR